MFLFFFLSYIGVQLIYSVGLISGEEQSDSVIRIHIFILFQIPLPTLNLRSSSSHTLPQGHRFMHPTPISVSPDGCFGSQWWHFTLGSPCPHSSAPEDAAGSHWGCCWRGGPLDILTTQGHPTLRASSSHQGLWDGDLLTIHQRETDKKTWGERERWRLLFLPADPQS